MGFAIETLNLTKKYNGLTAVDDISVQVNEGEVFGLLGPNGAGKTTFINMLATTLKPTSGTAVVNGFDILKNQSDVRKSIGVVFQEMTLDERLTGRENLEIHAMLYNMSKSARRSRIDEVLELVELKDRANSLVKTYSGGMKRRLEIARGLIHYPKILFLDEPTLGLDPQTRVHVWDYIKMLAKKEKITIILTTHYMEEADALCNRIAIIDYGKIIALDSPENLKNKLGNSNIILEVFDTEKAKQLFPNARILRNRVILPAKYIEREIGRIFRIAIKNQLQIYETSIHKPSLNDVFISLTGRGIRENGRNG
ncbi:MAG: ATP-binding cassette domain-containing protein [Candidatus Aenigmatarchaeota archaeon]